MDYSFNLHLLITHYRYKYFVILIGYWTLMIGTLLQEKLFLLVQS